MHALVLALFSRLCVLIEFSQVFPQNLSARQFRLAFKSVVQITTPPSPLASSQPLLASTLLELVHDRAYHASSTVLPPTPQASAGKEDAANSTPLSEQAALTLALIDSLSLLRVDDLEEWLPLTAKLINSIQDSGMRNTCVERFWDALSSGEMDVQRANFCVTWWSTRGGRELVLFGEQQQQQQQQSSHEEAVMSGGLGPVAPESKL